MIERGLSNLETALTMEIQRLLTDDPQAAYNLSNALHKVQEAKLQVDHVLDNHPRAKATGR